MERKQNFHQDEKFFKKLQFFIKNLRELNKLDKYHKLAIDNKGDFYLQDTNSEYLLGIRRWWYNFGRYQSVETINKFYQELFIFIDNLLDTYENNNCFKNREIAKENILILFEHIKYAKKGLIILKMIYKDDIKFVDGINKILNFTAKKCRNLTEIIYLKKKEYLKKDTFLQKKFT
jgi:hypothetical protein